MPARQDFQVYDVVRLRSGWELFYGNGVVEVHSGTVGIISLVDNLFNPAGCEYEVVFEVYKTLTTTRTVSCRALERFE